MKPLVIFGAGDIAELAEFYFRRQAKRVVKAFVVDDRYVKESRFRGLPVVALSRLAKEFPPSKFDAFVAMGYTDMNRARKEKYLAMKKAGYRLATFVSPKCTCLTDDIGDNCFILEDNTIQPFVKIGDDVTLWSGNHVGHRSTIGDHAFVTSHVVISGHVNVGEACFLGVNATLRDRITLGARTMIGAGALVVKDTAPGQVYKAEPAKLSKITSERLFRI